MFSQILLGIYLALLRAYPQDFRDRFAEEMLFVFERSLNRAGNQGRWALLELGTRELLQSPRVLLRLHRRYLKKSLAGWSASQLLSVKGRSQRMLDGRTSWLGAMLETSAFLILGAVLVAVTYLPLSWPQSGRWGEIYSLGAVVLWVALPAIFFGLLSGAPRWVYPFLGMVLGYAFITAQRDHLSGYLALSLCACGVLALAARRVDSSRRQLPLRYIGRELTEDWTRLSLAVYGVMPLLIQIAFDDTRFNNRTPFLAVSVCSMILGALAYSRSRRKSRGIVSLWGGLSLSILAVLLDQAYFRGGISAWFASQGAVSAEISWLFQLWAGMTALIGAPILLVLARRVLQPNPST